MVRWLRAPATETQVSHGQRLWLYVLATVIMIAVIPIMIWNIRRFRAEEASR